MDISDMEDGRIAIAGTKDELDAATTWARTMLHLAFGPVEGEERFRALPALAVMLAYRERVAHAPEC